jgi:hypothetical protein
LRKTKSEYEWAKINIEYSMQELIKWNMQKEIAVIEEMGIANF